MISSQYLGQKKMRRACEAADQLVLITGLLAVVIMGGSILFRRQLLTLLYGKVAEDVMANALIYLILSALSYRFWRSTTPAPHCSVPWGIRRFPWKRPLS